MVATFKCKYKYKYKNKNKQRSVRRQNRYRRKCFTRRGRGGGGGVTPPNTNKTILTQSVRYLDNVNILNSTQCNAVRTEKYTSRLSKITVSKQMGSFTIQFEIQKKDRPQNKIIHNMNEFMLFEDPSTSVVWLQEVNPNKMKCFIVEPNSDGTNPLRDLLHQLHAVFLMYPPTTTTTTT